MNALGTYPVGVFAPMKSKADSPAFDAMKERGLRSW
jgi:hypothetical protein